MRIPKAWIPLISKKIINDLLNKDLIIPQIPAETLVAKTEKLIMDELMAEDRLNEEVREILKKFSGDIEKGRLDYRKMFEITKKKLVAERGIIV
ncbi:MAG: DUF507 family protein [Nitrospirota bacterium]|mgnify:FL=1